MKHTYSISSRFLWLLALFILSFVFSGSLQAQERHTATSHTPQFFEILHDVPLMPSFTEIAESALAFDKAEGRFIQSEAVSETMAPESAQAFYETTLPQLGWNRIPDQQAKGLLFIRQNENLILNINQEEGVTFIHFTIHPTE